MASSFIWSGSDVFTMLLLRNELPALVTLWLIVGSMRPHVAATALLCFFAAVGAWSLLSSLTLPMSRAAVQGLGPEGLQVGWRGTFGHKNILGIFSVLGMGLVLAFERRPVWRPALVGVLLGASFGSRSATAASGMLATVATYAWLTVIGRVQGSRERAMLKLALIGSLVVSVLLIVGLLPMLVGIYGKDLTFSGRTEIWAATIEAIDHKPITGYGIGGVWFDVQAEVTRKLHGTIGFGASHAHNGFLNLWLESGLIGVALFGVVLARTIRLAVSCLRHPATAAYGRWALPSLAGFVLMSLSEPLFRGFGLGVVVITWTILARVVNDRDRGRPLIPVEGARPWWTIDPGYPSPAV
jgi:O-antigen ligase